MEIFGREWCHAYVWTVNGSALWTFRRDRQYWAAVYEVPCCCPFVELLAPHSIIVLKP